MKIIYPAEIQRIKFIIARDGIDYAIEFATRGIKIYRNGVLRSHKRLKTVEEKKKISHLSVDKMRVCAILSYLQYRDFLKNPRMYMDSGFME